MKDTTANGMYEHEIQRALRNRHRSSARIMLPNYTPIGWYECDLYVVTAAMYTIEYEVKLSVVDFKADWRKCNKHLRLAERGRRGPWCPNRYYFAVPEGLLSPEAVPEYAGLVYLRWLFKNPSDRAAAPREPIETIVRPAPRLSTVKVTEKTINAMRQTAYHRFWTERLNFEDYRRTVDAERRWGER